LMMLGITHTRRSPKRLTPTYWHFFEP